jgi:hypothetical protein
VLFWLATLGWLFQRDLLPRFRKGGPPPYSIDLAYEAQNNASAAVWMIFRDGQRLGRVDSWVKYADTSDTFELHGFIRQLRLGRIGPIELEGREMNSMFRVTREGELREMSHDGTLAVQGVGLARGLGLEAQVKMAGVVSEQQFRPQVSITIGDQSQELPLDPVEVSRHANVLNPLHPVSRILGLRHGQTWQQPLVDPLADSLTALLKKDPALEFLLQRHQRASALLAEVLPETRILNWENSDVPCLVIEYRGDEVVAHTWVRETDGKVLRQEATVWGEQLVLERL